MQQLEGHLTLKSLAVQVMLSDGSVVKLDAKARQSIEATINDMAARALRCLALAQKRSLGELASYDGEQHPAHVKLLEPANYAGIESGLTLLGLAGLQVGTVERSKRGCASIAHAAASGTSHPDVLFPLIGQVEGRKETMVFLCMLITLLHITQHLHSPRALSPRCHHWMSLEWPYACLQDPPRPEVRGAMEDCKRAGIRVMVITGDNKLTAEAICRKIGVFGEDQDLSGVSMTGRDFEALSASRKLEVMQGTGGRCFSRAEPKHKQVGPCGTQPMPTALSSL